MAFDVSELSSAAVRLEVAGEQVDESLRSVFNGWVDEVHEIMRDEVPVDEGDLRDSIEVERGDGLTAEIRPTERVPGKGGTTHSLGHIIEHGAGNRAPNPFMARTAVRARDVAPTIDASDVL